MGKRIIAQAHVTCLSVAGATQHAAGEANGTNETTCATSGKTTNAAQEKERKCEFGIEPTNQRPNDHKNNGV